MKIREIIAMPFGFIAKVLFVISVIFLTMWAIIGGNGRLKEVSENMNTISKALGID